MAKKSWKYKTKHGLNTWNCWSHLFHRWDDLNTLFELHFAPGKLPLNRLHRDDFPDLKPIFVPKLHMKNINLSRKTFKYTKNVSHRPHKTRYLRMLVKIKEILNKMYFCMPSKLQHHFLLLTHNKLYFWSKFSPPKVSKYQTWDFFIHSLPPGAPNKVFELQLYTDRYTDANDCIYMPPPDPKYPYPKNSATVTRNGLKWRISILYLHVWGAFPLFLVLFLLVLVIHSWGRTNISILDRGRLIKGLYKAAHSKIYIFICKIHIFK